jgi:Mg2+/citrate symporter
MIVSTAGRKKLEMLSRIAFLVLLVVLMVFLAGRVSDIAATVVGSSTVSLISDINLEIVDVVDGMSDPSEPVIRICFKTCSFFRP